MSSTAADQQPELHIVILGEPNVGKSSILSCLNYSPSAYKQSLLKFSLEDKVIKVHFHEFGGKYFNQLKAFVKSLEADLFGVVFSHFERGSFDKSVSQWHAFLKESKPGKPIIFVSTKLDLLASKLSETADQVATAGAERRGCAAKIAGLNASYFECSALTKEGIKETIESMIIRAAASKGLIRSSIQSAPAPAPNTSPHQTMAPQVQQQSNFNPSAANQNYGVNPGQSGYTGYNAPPSAYQNQNTPPMPNQQGMGQPPPPNWSNPPPQPGYGNPPPPQPRPMPGPPPPQHYSQPPPNPQYGAPPQPSPLYQPGMQPPLPQYTPGPPPMPTRQPFPGPPPPAAPQNPQTYQPPPPNPGAPAPPPPFPTRPPGGLAPPPPPPPPPSRK